MVAALIAGALPWPEMSDAPEPTLRDVLREVRGINARLDAHGAQLAKMATREDLADLRRDLRARLEALRADHGERLEALGSKVETLRADLETLSRVLLTDLPPAMAAAVERVFGPLRADVEELKRKVG